MPETSNRETAVIFFLPCHFCGVTVSFLAVLDHAWVKNWGNKSFLCLKMSCCLYNVGHSPKCCFSLLFLRVLSSCFSWIFFSAVKNKNICHWGNYEVRTWVPSVIFILQISQSLSLAVLVKATEWCDQKLHIMLQCKKNAFNNIRAGAIFIIDLNILARLKEHPINKWSPSQVPASQPLAEIPLSPIKPSAN